MRVVMKPIKPGQSWKHAGKENSRHGSRTGFTRQIAWLVRFLWPDISMRCIATALFLPAIFFSASCKPDNAAEGELMWVAEGGAKLWEGRSFLRGNAIMDMPRGLQLRILERFGAEEREQNLKGRWARAKASGIEGWVFDAFLS